MNEGSKGLKVLILNWMDPKNPKNGGQEKYCHEMAKRLVGDGNQVIWVCSSFPGSLKEEYIDGIKIIRAGNIYTVFIRSFFLYLTYKSSDIVLLSMNSIPFLTPFHKKIIMLHHRIELSVLKKKFRLIGIIAYVLQDFLMPFLYKEDVIFTVSESSKLDFLSHGYKNIEVVRTGVEIPNSKLLLKEKYIVSPGPVKPWKHHDWVLRAFRALGEEWHLIIFGAYENITYRDTLFELARNLGIENRVEFLGYIDNKNLIGIYSKSSICVLASEKEGWGLVAMEAQAYGCPVIGFNVPGLSESVSDGKTGILVKLGDIESLSNSIKLVADNDEYRNILSQAGIERAKNYNWDNCYDDFKKILYRVA